MSVPIALFVTHRYPHDWSQVGGLVQPIVATGSILTALTLIGVVYNAILQSRAIDAQRELAVSSLHFDLTKLALSDSELDTAWGSVSDNKPNRRIDIYVNMILSHWELMFSQRMLSELELKQLADDLFSGAPARMFWSRSRAFRSQRARARRGTAARFHRIADTAFQNAGGTPANDLTKGAALIGPSLVASGAGPNPTDPRRPQSWHRKIGNMTLVAGGIAYVLRQQARRGHRS